VARIRSIKPEFWTDDSITECSLSARLLFIGIWNFADDAGNLDRSAKQIKARVFPLDNIDCEPLIRELITHGLLIEYSVSDRKYLHIPGFAVHQVINRPSAPLVPGYEDSLRTPVTLTESSVSTHSGEEGKGGEGKGRSRGSLRRASPPDIPFPQPPLGLDIPTWERWLAYRKDTGKPIKPASIEAAMNALARFGEYQAAVVTQSIANGWQGLFDLKPSKGGTSAQGEKWM
jgi:hypothetical protein